MKEGVLCVWLNKVRHSIHGRVEIGNNADRDQKTTGSVQGNSSKAVGRSWLRGRSLPLAERVGRVV